MEATEIVAFPANRDKVWLRDPPGMAIMGQCLFLLPGSHKSANKAQSTRPRRPRGSDQIGSRPQGHAKNPPSNMRGVTKVLPLEKQRVSQCQFVAPLLAKNLPESSHPLVPTERMRHVTGVVAGPIGPKGKVEIFCSGLGRPQGMAFDMDGNLYVAEALAGDSGIYRFTPSGERQCIVSSPPLVGLAFDGQGGAMLAGAGAVFYLQLGIQGLPLF